MLHDLILYDYHSELIFRILKLNIFFFKYVSLIILIFWQNKFPYKNLLKISVTYIGIYIKNRRVKQLVLKKNRSPWH